MKFQRLCLLLVLGIPTTSFAFPNLTFDVLFKNLSHRLAKQDRPPDDDVQNHQPLPTPESTRKSDPKNPEKKQTPKTKIQETDRSPMASEVNLNPGTACSFEKSTCTVDK